MLYRFIIPIILMITVLLSCSPQIYSVQLKPYDYNSYYYKYYTRYRPYIYRDYKYVVPVSCNEYAIAHVLRNSKNYDKNVESLTQIIDFNSNSSEILSDSNIERLDIIATYLHKNINRSIILLGECNDKFLERCIKISRYLENAHRIGSDRISFMVIDDTERNLKNSITVKIK